MIAAVPDDASKPYPSVPAALERPPGEHRDFDAEPRDAEAGGADEPIPF